MSVLLAIAILATLVLVHEAGHFLAARGQGIHVSQFSLGFGPTLWKYQGDQTEYALRLFPLGGYVGFPDDDPESKIPDHDPNLLKNRPILDRAIVISAGVIANFIFAYFVLLMMITTVGIPVADQPGIKISQIIGADAPAAIAGLRAGDVILAVDQAAIGNQLSNLDQFQALVAERPEVHLSVARDQQNLEFTVIPQGKPGRIGVGLSWNGTPRRQPITNPWEALAIATQEFNHLITTTWHGLVQLATNFSSVSSQVSGPVAIVAAGAQLAKSNQAGLFDFTAIISINLAIINLLPLPALDGGQLLFLLIELLRGGKPLPAKLQENVMQGGLVVILGLGLFMVARDSLGLIQQSGLIPL
ncbi:MAG: RIP metalloprotease RseP [Pseudanabaenaceae cyanobacterium bins.68]|nr:RIP metalloprotease RseP [Pseudanabaenaceae cyanobacterium bins.68]